MLCSLDQLEKQGMNFPPVGNQDGQSYVMKPTRGITMTDGTTNRTENGFTTLRKARSMPQERKAFFTFGADGQIYQYKDLKEVWRNDPFGTLAKRYISFVESLSEEKEKIEHENEAVIVVDPFSSGAILAGLASKKGYRVIRIFSQYNSPVAKLVQQNFALNFDGTVQHDERDPDGVAKTIEKITQLPFSTEAVVAGAEPGVDLSDALSSRMGIRSNGEELSKARRNKHLMGEQVRKCGVRAVKQKHAKTWDEVVAFLRDLYPSENPEDLEKRDDIDVVIKPIQSAGTDSVLRCKTLAEAQNAFFAINGQVNGLGNVNDGALVQEFLTGTEFVVDAVSRDGVHKVVAIWEYDKRDANDASFVYYGMTLRSCEGLNSLIEYNNAVLDALGICNGPSHAEIMMTKTGPCLIEVGSRCHGGEGTWAKIVDECIGYNQMEATINAYVDEDAFAAMASTPKNLLKHGREVFLVSYTNGVVRQVPGLERIKALESYRSHEMAIRPGDFLKKTVDCFTRPGSVQLVHESQEALDRDTDTIRALEKKGLFDMQVICKKPPEQGAVVIVDPFSSGAVMAAKVLKDGYRLVLVNSVKNSPFEGRVKVDEAFKADHTIQHDAESMEEDIALQRTAESIEALPYRVLAVLPGSEPGVLLGDTLAARLSMRCNDLSLSDCRRDKFKMHEQLRKCGVRAVRQCKAVSWDDIESSGFLNQWADDEKFKVVVKPIESVGSDDVYLCRSRQEVKKRVEFVVGKMNGMGTPNRGVVVQEFLEGIEYVVDAVSRDGVHKVVTVWEYDKRDANGASFVYFGMRCRAVDNDVMRGLIEYNNQVLDALSLDHGASHAEIKITPTGPCLIEVGARPHGGTGTWKKIVDECVGYNQIDITLDAYLRPERFDQIPPYPAKLAKTGLEVFLVSYREGIVKSISGIEKIRKLKSFLSLEMSVQFKSKLKKTIDLFSRPGSVQLLHEDPSVVEKDYETIRQLESEGIFELEDD